MLQQLLQRQQMVQMQVVSSSILELVKLLTKLEALLQTKRMKVTKSNR